MPRSTTSQLPRASFAPPLTDELLTEYATLINAQPVGPLRDALAECLVATRLWWDLPESSRTDGDRFVYVRRNPSLTVVAAPDSGPDERTLKEKGFEEFTVQETPLTDELIADLDTSVPWPHELDAIQKLFDGIPADQRDLRNCAFHLLWHVRELCLDREPVTQDKLPALGVQ